MASNHELILVTDSDWLGGFANLAAKENRRWWKTRRWLVFTSRRDDITNDLNYDL